VWNLKPYCPCRTFTKIPPQSDLVFTGPPSGFPPHTRPTTTSCPAPPASPIRPRQLRRDPRFSVPGSFLISTFFNRGTPPQCFWATAFLTHFLLFCLCPVSKAGSSPHDPPRGSLTSLFLHPQAPPPCGGLPGQPPGFLR